MFSVWLSGASEGIGIDMRRGENHLSLNPKGGSDTQATSFTAIIMAENISKGKGN